MVTGTVAQRKRERDREVVQSGSRGEDGVFEAKDKL